MQVLEQVVQATTKTLNRPTQGHLVFPALALGLEGDSVNVICHEAAVRSGGVAEALLGHTAQDCIQTRLVAVVVAPHLLQIGANAHLSTCDGHRGIEEIKVGQLSIDTVIDNVQGLEVMLERVFNDQRALQRTTLQWQRLYGRRVKVMVGIDPRLSSGFAVGWENEDDVLGPERPAWQKGISACPSADGSNNKDSRLKYLASVKARVTPFKFNSSSAVFHAATKTIASVASPRGA